MHIKWVMSYPDLLHSNFGFIFYFPVCASMRLFQCNFLMKNSRHVKAWHFNLPRVFGARNSWSKTTALHRKYVGHLETGKFVQRIPCLNDQLHTTSFQQFIERICKFSNLWILCFNLEFLFSIHYLTSHTREEIAKYQFAIVLGDSLGNPTSYYQPSPTCLPSLRSVGGDRGYRIFHTHTHTHTQ